MNSSAARHFALLATVGIDFLAERDLPVLHADGAVVEDGHPVRLARQIVENMFRPTEVPLGINHPWVRQPR
jgi:trimethylamine:corrinoid methyltransferase-like protein